MKDVKYLLLSGVVFAGIVFLAGALLALIGMLLFVTIIGIIPGLILIVDGVAMITFLVIYWYWFIIIGAVIGYIMKPTLKSYIAHLKDKKK